LRIPYWLSRLLPVWTYICPKCRKEVKANSHKCPHCGEKYPLAVRVPPSFLKDPKKLEAYVHKHVFPRISKFERAYLEQFFTIIFIDGWENSGGTSVTDNGAWTNADGSPTVTGAVVHSGKWAMQTNAVVEADVRKDIGSTHPNVNFRTYFYVATISDNFSDFNVLALFDTSVNLYATAAFYNVNGSLHWAFTSISTAFADTGVAISLNIWHYAEISCQGHSASNGVATLYFDGNQIKKNINQAMPNNIEWGYVGIVSAAAATIKPLYYWDDCEIADTYIGALPTTPIQTYGDGLTSYTC